MPLMVAKILVVDDEPDLESLVTAKISTQDSAR